jgi:NAD(P)-dependent dehydrogenase (short-subunit alcohol dehydrogenase family)
MWTKNNIPDQTGKIIIVTGSNNGIGYETAFALYEKGADIVLACRNLESAEDAINRMKQEGGTGTLTAITLDLSSLASVKSFAENFIARYGHLDILINNAGVALSPLTKTAEGYELQFGTNFLGHFALTGYLYPLLKKRSSSRVVSLSSTAYMPGSIDFDNLKAEKSYDAAREYCQSKLATTVFAIELQRRIHAAGEDVLSVVAQPGANSTGLARHMTEEEKVAAQNLYGELMQPWQGALPSLYATTVAEIKPGGFYQPDQDGGLRGYPTEADLLPHALDKAIGKKLWNVGEGATGVVYP